MLPIFIFISFLVFNFEDEFISEYAYFKIVKKITQLISKLQICSNLTIIFKVLLILISVPYFLTIKDVTKEDLRFNLLF